MIEATGAREGWRDAIALARRGGTVVLFGGLPEGVAALLASPPRDYLKAVVRP